MADPPYIAQDVHETAEMVKALQEGTKGTKHAKQVKKQTYKILQSPYGYAVDSWKFEERAFKTKALPTYARGLFTTRNSRNEPEIVARGYDKFFNVGEVTETTWDHIMTRTQGPYELTLKENGCIIFISGLEDDTLLVCSKHATGERQDLPDISHASAGERRVEEQLARMGKTKQDLARELRRRNATAVAELCDDSFEEHILAYGPESAGLYLHGINLNLPKFHTYSSQLVQQFADEWGFLKIGLIVMDDAARVRSFLEEVAETGAHDGRDVEGFVIRCRMSPNPDTTPFHDWFFKFKFEEPYLMYRQWRECTKAMIAGKAPRFKKHKQITEEYLMYAKRRLVADPALGKRYMNNHGIIQLRDDFLAYKNLKGADAANMEAGLEVEGGESSGLVSPEVTGNVILVPIATIGCGKTTVGQALARLLDWGHIQNDNITGKGKKPPRFTKMVLDQLKDHKAVLADRNNAARHERKQIITDVKLQNGNARLVALHFKHDRDNLEDIRRVTRDRVVERGDNHQTIHATTDQAKFFGVMEGFIDRFEPCNPMIAPDDGFDAVINLDPVANSRVNLETVVTQLHRLYPNLVTEVPAAEEMDAAISFALGYEPTIKHTIPDRRRPDQTGPKSQGQESHKGKKQPLEYMSVDVPAKNIHEVLEAAFGGRDPEASKFYMQLKQTRRIQAKFHVTLMHRATAKQHPELWERYRKLHAEAGENIGSLDAKLGDCGVMLERIVFDSRVMAIVVRLVDESVTWECVNRVAHITVGTRDASVKPKESNDLLAKWLDDEDASIHDVVIEEKPTIQGVVRGVCNSFIR